MTNEQIDLVRTSFAKIEPIAEKAAALFYAKLFDLDPQLRHLFKGDIYEQGKKLMQVISYTVENLDGLDKISPVVRELGVRHKTYGVVDQDYETVGEALLWTFEKALGREFTIEMRAAWVAVYDLLAKTMQEGVKKESLSNV